MESVFLFSCSVFVPMIDSGIYTAWLPKVDDEAILKTDMDGLTGVNEVNVFIPSDKIVLVTIGLKGYPCPTNGFIPVLMMDISSKS